MVEDTRLMTSAIELTDSERGILAQIKLDGSPLHDHTEARRNGEAVCGLVKLLIARKAIPKPRVSFFTDPAYNIGGHGRSRQAVFERNGTRGEDIFRHSHFIKILRYFIFGASLPQTVTERFCSEVSGCGPVTSGDIEPLAKLAKQQTHAHGLEPREAAEEFYKLALDCGLSPDYAGHIRNAVRRLK